jgi:putative transposase
MEQMRLDYPLGVLCRVLGVSASGFHARRSRGPSRRAQQEPRLEIEIRAAHQRTRQTYGAERLQRDLAAHGVCVGVHRIKRVRRQLGLRCKQRRKFKVTTDSRHSLPVAENLLEQRFEAAGPCRAWLTDITYVPTDEGWLYLVGHKDLCTRKIVGYAMGARMTKNLVMESLLRAVETTQPSTDLLHHSDKGSQYCSHEYRRMLEGLGIKASMSGTGNCFDNAPMESFRATLKTELIFHRRFATRHQAICEITEYMEVFYNRQRIQKQLDYLSPPAFERRYYERRLAA